MMLVIVKNAHTKTTQHYLCYHVEMGNNMLGFPLEGAKQVHLFCGTFGRSDSSICVETFEKVTILTNKWLDAHALAKHEYQNA